MSLITSEKLIEGLSAKGNNRNKFIKYAAQILLNKYLTNWEQMIPIELHRLAASLNAKIVRSKSLNGEAFLMPVEKGFRIVVNANVPLGRYRTSVAHEIVHILFYDVMNTDIPVRIIQHSELEEYFCFDVSRYILAPLEHLKAIRVFNEKDPEVIFKRLTDVLLLSRPVASRIMLSDYPLVTGIAGRWTVNGDEWNYKFHSSSASPDLSRKEKSNLKTEVKNFLEKGLKPSKNIRVIKIEEQSPESVFVIAAFIDR